MQRTVVGLLGALFLVAWAGCERPSAEDCEAACWKVGELAFWEKKEAEIKAAADDEEREILREEAKEEWAEIKSGEKQKEEVHRCKTSCTKKGSPDQIKCLATAKDMKAVRACSGMDFRDKDD